MNKRKLIPRLLILPLMLIIYLIPIVILYFKYIKAFFLYGGEFVTYFEKNEVDSVQRLYHTLKQEKGETKPIEGKYLVFIKKILKNGDITSPMRTDHLEDEKFYLRPLSLSEGTFIAHGFNSYIVKKKLQ